jgi:predicted transposase YbfD/YdcC
MEADFPFARSLMVVRNARTVKKTGHTTIEPHYYLSSLPPGHYTRAQWLRLIRGHWAGVEIRNHWRRDALMGEDGSRSRNPNLLANLALIRSVLLGLIAEQFADKSLPEVREQLNANPNQAFALLAA